jgi:hypothetical protein
MTRMRRALIALAAASALYSGVARAAPSAADKSRAAAAYDAGVKHFDRAEYGAAARAFLKADSIVPSADAVENAIVAARKANDHLLVVQTARRAEAHAPDNPKLAAEAREALAEAAPHLARVQLGCDVAPCHLVLDGDPADAGSHYLLPGTHSVDAVAGSARAHRNLALNAGATYRVVLHPAAPAAHATRPAPAAAPTQPSRRATPPDAPHRPLSPPVFYLGAAVTVGLAAATTWSGLDALAKKRDLPADYSPVQGDDVRSRMRRSDYLLGGAVLAGAITAWMGISLVDWGGGKASAALAPTRRGAVGALGGRF